MLLALGALGLLTPPRAVPYRWKSVQMGGAGVVSDSPFSGQPRTIGGGESVARQLSSPTRGPWLFSALGDSGGFVHRDLDRPADEVGYATARFGSATGIAVGDLNPNVVVAVGRTSGARRGGNLAFSLDGGRNWRPSPATPPDAQEGAIAVSADGRVWLWSLRSGAFRSEDDGAVWTRCESGGEPLAAGLKVVADRVSPARFYALDPVGDRLHTSVDGGRTFVGRDLRLPGGSPPPGDRGDALRSQDTVYATPGRSGDLWVAAFDGLYHAAPARGFERLGGVSEVDAFGFGRGATGETGPALYMAGVVDGVRGVFRSTDDAESWFRIVGEANPRGRVLQIEGDFKRFGRVYLGTLKGSVLYGDPR